MKYTCEIVIDSPRSRVIELFDNPDNMSKWQEGLISFEHLSGDPGKVGAKSKLKYRMGKREIEMIETITVNKLPDEFSGTYEADKTFNDFKNYFSETDDGRTKWVAISEFKMSGFMKLMGWLMPGAFKKQTMKFMTAFKAFVENEN
jgi:hypothetical protein